jgi:exosortase
VVETLLPIPPDSQPEAASGDTAPPSDRGQPPTPSGRLGFLSARHVALAVVAIALGWAYAPNLRSLVTTWNQEPNYSHGFLVLPVALVIVWRRWVEEEPPAIMPSWWGWAGLVGMLIVRAVCYERGAEWTETATLLPVIACLTLAAGGWPLLRRVWPAIAFLVFLLPLPLRVNSILAQPLQRVATTWSTALLKLTGLWVVAEGNVILVGGDQLEVAAACNGLSMLMCLAATVAAMTILVPMAVWKRVALFLSIIPIALVSNVLRIAATAWCYHLFGAKVGGHFAHDAAGWLMMPVALILVGLELALLSWLVIEVEELPAGRPDHLLRRRPT